MTSKRLHGSLDCTLVVHESMKSNHHISEFAYGYLQLALALLLFDYILYTQNSGEDTGPEKKFALLKKGSKQCGSDWSRLLNLELYFYLKKCSGAQETKRKYVL